MLAAGGNISSNPGASTPTISGRGPAGNPLADHLRIAAEAALPVLVLRIATAGGGACDIGRRGSRGQRLRQAVGVLEVAPTATARPSA